MAVYMVAYGESQVSKNLFCPNIFDLVKDSHKIKHETQNVVTY